MKFLFEMEFEINLSELNCLSIICSTIWIKVDFTWYLGHGI